MHKTGIQLTPTWRGVLRLLLESYANGGENSRSEALKELYRMADLADETVKRESAQLAADRDAETYGESATAIYPEFRDNS